MDHGMTNEEVAATPLGTTLHFANWPGMPSRPVELLDNRGVVRFEDGTVLHAFADELSREPRPEGLGS